MPDFPFMSYQVDPYVNPTDPPSSLYPTFRGERCASWRPDPVPRGLYIQYAGATSARGNQIFQGSPLEANAFGGSPGFGSAPSFASGPRLAGTGANGSGGPGNPVWTNPGNVANTGLYATASFATPGTSGGSSYLYATGFSFSITPPTFLITGINVIGVAYSDASADMVGLELQLLKAGHPVGDPKTIPLPSAAAAFNVGGPGDGWNVPGGLLASDVNLSTFGVAVAGVYQNSHSSGIHSWNIDSVNITIYTQDPGLAPWQGSTTGLSGIFSLPYGGGMPIASWTASSIGVLQNITDVRPSGLTAMPTINGFQEQTLDDPKLTRTIDQSYHVRTDHLQPTGQVYVGPGQIKLPNNSIVTFTNQGPPQYSFFGPFVRNSVIAGQSAVTGRPGVPDAVKGNVQIFIDQTGTITWNDAPAYPMPITVFPNTVFPLAVVSIDSACRVFDVIDARPYF